MFVLNKLKSIWPILAKFQILSQESKNKILFIIPKLFEKKKDSMRSQNGVLIFYNQVSRKHFKVFVINFTIYYFVLNNIKDLMYVIYIAGYVK